MLLTRKRKAGEKGPGADWAVRTLGDVAKTMSGGTPNRKRSEYFGGPIAWVKSGELEDGFIDSTEEQISQLGLENSSAKVFPTGTLLMAMYGATVGRTAILRIEAATNQAICAIVPNPDVLDPEFLRYALINMRGAILAQRHGGAQPNVSQQIVRNLKVPVPPLDEQTRVAALLALVQRAITQQEKLVSATAELRRTLVHKAVTRGLRLQPQEQTEIGVVPEPWRVTPLSDYLAEARYGTSTKGGPNGRHALLRMTNQKDGRIFADDLQYVDLSADEFERFRVKQNDILFNRTNSLDLVGRTAIFRLDGEYVFASYLIRLRTHEAKLRAQFLNLYLNTDEAQARLKSIATRAVSQSNISAARLRGFLIPVPSPKEQDEIVAAAEALQARVSFHKRKRTALNELFGSLLHGLMSRQIQSNTLDVDRLGIA